MLGFAPGRPIPEPELRTKLQEFLSQTDFTRDRLLVIVPDDTRTLPMPVIYEALIEAVLPRVKELAFLVALGTHPPLSEAQLSRHFGPRFPHPRVRVYQHAWADPQALVRVGEISRDRMAQISRGLLALEVAVEVNRLALAYDQILLVGPVFPHEVVGFSGGHKYLFPGISGPTMVNVSHWLGALITNPKVNGHKWTPVREMIEEAARCVPTPRLGLSLVLRGHEVLGLFLGEVVEAWEAAADLSAKVNIVWAPRAYDFVLSLAPPMYRELWLAGKCMYKLEPVVADGGTLVIYAPHIREISPTHGEWLLQVGYHVRDFFLAQWEKYKHVPWAVLAHATHVKGIGTFRAGVERPRIQVILATGIPEEVCRRINLGYHDPRTLNPEAFRGREAEGILVVPNAGEQLWRLADGTVPDIDRL
ncbi:MAG: lactate racemase domain-containing protein [Candidatus Bipolaricaulota bacterium]|nr:lactate racemase domain-containing protein [Candidatus Bipolaricaulota bacterium]MDW8152319.1 lactate racemase domain-containing protein [Candidatus Bipolaricaulota bacterium]